MKRNSNERSSFEDDDGNYDSAYYTKSSEHRLGPVCNSNSLECSFQNGVVYPKKVDNPYYRTNDGLYEERNEILSGNQSVAQSNIVKLTLNPYYGVDEDIVLSKPMGKDETVGTHTNELGSPDTFLQHY